MADMGIGQIGKPGVIVKRKFRWTLAIDTPSGSIPAYYCKLASRPNLSIEPTEINYLNSTQWLPGKARWEPISVTYIDVAVSSMQPLWSWITSIYDFNSNSYRMSEKAGWNATATLRMLDGCGSTLETWTLGSVFPESIDFGDLDYSSSEEATIELSLRYSEVNYQGGCGSPTPSGTCKGCG